MTIQISSNKYPLKIFFKRLLGWIIILNFIPVLGGFIPFDWENKSFLHNYLIGWEFVLGILGFIGFVFLMFWLFDDE